MTNALALFATFKELVRNPEVDTKVPEPEFKPFRFPKEEAVAQPGGSLPPTWRASRGRSRSWALRVRWPATWRRRSG